MDGGSGALARPFTALLPPGRRPATAPPQAGLRSVNGGRRCGRPSRRRDSWASRSQRSTRTSSPWPWSAPRKATADALHFLYVRFADDVCGYVNDIVRNLDESRDITQNVFGRAEDRDPEVRAARGSLRGMDPARGRAMLRSTTWIAREDAQLRQVLLSLQGRRLPLAGRVLQSGGLETCARA